MCSEWRRVVYHTSIKIKGRMINSLLPLPKWPKKFFFLWDGKFNKSVDFTILPIKLPQNPFIRPALQYDAGWQWKIAVYRRWKCFPAFGMFPQVFEMSTHGLRWQKLLRVCQKLFSRSHSAKRMSKESQKMLARSPLSISQLPLC